MASAMMNNKTEPSNRLFLWASPTLRVLRWLCLIPIAYYAIGGVFWSITGLGVLGFSALTTVPIGTIWFTAFGQGWYDLLAVFFERKITFVLFDYPLGGEQIYWNWLQPSFNQSPVVWLGIAIAWGIVWAAFGFLLGKAREATNVEAG